MKKMTSILAACLLSGCSGKHEATPVARPPVFAEIVAKSSCMGCHQAGNSMQLPTWLEISKKYKGQLNAEQRLVDKIAAGGSGSWGKMDMPPYPELNEAERRVLVQAILAK